MVVSALQGGDDHIVDGQLALARAAHEQGAWRMIPSDFALDLFAATPGEHPAFDRRRRADDAIAGVGIEHLHVLNGAFFDGMVNMGFDHDARTVSYWGTGDDEFETTTIEDTARFTARAALDPDLVSGPFPIIGDRVSPNTMTDTVERITGEHYTRRSQGTVEDLRALLADVRSRGDSEAQTGLAYLLYMANGQTAVTNPQNRRTRGLFPTSPSTTTFCYHAGRHVAAGDTFLVDTPKPVAESIAESIAAWPTPRDEEVLQVTACIERRPGRRELHLDGPRPEEARLAASTAPPPGVGVRATILIRPRRRHADGARSRPLRIRRSGPAGPHYGDAARHPGPLERRPAGGRPGHRRAATRSGPSPAGRRRPARHPERDHNDLPAPPR